MKQAGVMVPASLAAALCSGPTQAQPVDHRIDLRLSHTEQAERAQQMFGDLPTPFGQGLPIEPEQPLIQAPARIEIEPHDSTSTAASPAADSTIDLALRAKSTPASDHLTFALERRFMLAACLPPHPPSSH
jgi:hypothetical protein